LREEPSFGEDDPSERLGVIQDETNFINVEFCRESPEQALIPIATIRRQAGITLLCPLGQKIPVDLVRERNVGDRYLPAFLLTEVQALDRESIGGGGNAPPDGARAPTLGEVRS
jgi:hypothetical protein